tara:strand:+ start:164 stop:382 length:219 start_codon:yes stop_codon:yes gene_type:complete
MTNKNIHNVIFKAEEKPCGGVWDIVGYQDNEMQNFKQARNKTHAKKRAAEQNAFYQRNTGAYLELTDKVMWR